jgi:hypothetical protein
VRERRPNAAIHCPLACVETKRLGLRYSCLRPSLLATLAIFIIHSLVFSQNFASSKFNQSTEEKRQADSVFLRIKSILSPVTAGPSVTPEKCGFHYQSDIRRYWNLFSADQRALIKSVFARPSMQASVLSPSGHFRIHYDTTGVNTPALIDQNDVRLPNTARAYVDSAAAIFDYVWEQEIGRLGYPAPPPDKGAGGGDEYDVYVKEFNRILYGETVFGDEDLLDSLRPNPTYMTYMEVDNDFIGYFTKGLQALKVTAAHEFHHAIQVGNYGFWQEDRYYYELTSTWIESTVFQTIHDYYQYLPTYFANTSVPFNVSNGYVEYGRAIWGKFIEKRFGQWMMKRSWEYINSVRPLWAVDASLKEGGSEFIRELPEFALWHFYTGHRADPVDFFTDGSSYPEVRPVDIVDFIPPSATISYTARDLSIQFFQVVTGDGGSMSDTTSIALTNINLPAAEQGNDHLYDLAYNITNASVDESYESLSNGLKVKLIVDDPTNWKSIAIIKSGINLAGQSFPYPNPFIIGMSSSVSFPVDVTQQTSVTLNIYSSSLDLVCSRVEDPVNQLGRQVVVWDGKNSNGRQVSSGIYIYRIVSGDKEYKGKIAVVRQ